MISRLSIKNYKCYDEEKIFNLPGLTIATGTNNSGKSSFLEAIHLLTNNESKLYPIITLKDNFGLDTFSKIFNNSAPYNESLEIGFLIDEIFLEKIYFRDRSLKTLDILYKFISPNQYNKISMYGIEDYPILSSLEIIYFVDSQGDPNEIILKLNDDEKDYSYNIYKNSTYIGTTKIENLVPSSIVLNLNDNYEIFDDLSDISYVLTKLLDEKMHYLKALRLQDYKYKSLSIDNPNVGIFGEYTAQVINRKWDTRINFGNSENVYFKDEFNKWICKLLGDDYSIKSEKISNGNYKIKITDSFSRIELTLEQVGFGISQLLPMLTVILGSNKDDLILIENPEVHLHPKLQSIFMELCIFAVNGGRKIIIETQSEHLINKLRLHIKNNSEFKYKSNIYFFNKNITGSDYTEIKIDNDGRIAYWPEDFFDQNYYDYLGLIKND